MALIDLGERQDSALDGSGPRRPPPIGRPARAALLVALLLGTLTAAAPVAAPLTGVSVPARRGVEIVIAGDRLYLVDPATSVRGRQRYLAAFALPAVRPLWQVALPPGQEQWSLRTRGDLLLLSGAVPGAPSVQTIALAPTTGQHLWRLPGRPLSTGNDGVLLYASSVDGRAVGGSSTADGTGTLVSVEPLSGVARWSRPVGDNDIALTDDRRDPGRLIVASSSGRVELLGLSSGAVLKSAQLLPFERELSSHSAHLVGDLLLIGRGDALHGYGLDRLDLRWQRSAPAVGGHLQACVADSVCLVDEQGGLELLDAATGQVRWRNDETFHAEPIGDRLLATSGTDEGGISYRILDPATGQVRAELGSWEITSNGTRDGRVVALRQTRTGQTLVAELDPVAGRARPLEVLPGPVDSCSTDGRVLACPSRVDGTVGVWRLGR